MVKESLEMRLYKPTFQSPRWPPFLLILLTGINFVLPSCSSNKTQKTPGKSDLVAFVNASLISMTNDRIIPHSIVMVSNGRIKQVGIEGKMSIPAHAFRIDCHEQYLSPGLTDMHAHALQNYQMTLFLANGITSIRNMWGFPQHLNSRILAEHGEIITPHIYTSGPVTDGPNPIWPDSVVAADTETARRLVFVYNKEGYDAFKVYQKLSPEVFDAIMTTAKVLKFPVWGHVPDRVPLEHALKMGMTSIEHLWGYGRAITSDPGRFSTPGTNAKTNILNEYRAWKFADYDKMKKIAMSTKETGAWNCPTLFAMYETEKSTTMRRIMKSYGFRYIHPDLKKEWMAFFNNSRHSSEYLEGGETRYDMVRALHNVGAKLLIGTDCNNAFVIHGYSLKEEAICFTKAGFTPFEIMHIIIHDAAVFLNQEKEFGTIEAGKRADLVLFAANPFKNIANISKIQGVMVYGKWLSREKLDKMLAEIIKNNLSYLHSTGQ